MVEISNEILQALQELARKSQDATSFTGDADYDLGYETGRWAVGEELELLLRHNGLWQDK